MAIKLNKFVDVSIKHTDLSTITSSRNTCVLILFNQTENKEEIITINNYKDNNLYNNFKVYFDSFFDNLNGVQEAKIKVISKTGDGSSANLVNVVETLDYKEIVIASNLNYNIVKEACKDYNNSVESDIYKKIFLSYIPQVDEEYEFSQIENLVIKFGNEEIIPGVPGEHCEASLSDDTEVSSEKTYYSKSQDSGHDGYIYVDSNGYEYTSIENPTGNPHTSNYYEVILGSDPISKQINTYYKGIEMTIAAYLCKIDINKYDTIQDYMFTLETIKNIQSHDFKLVEDDSLAGDLMQNGINFNSNVIIPEDSDYSRNIGGNDATNVGIINQFMLICLNQTLSERLMELIVKKIKYSTQGLNMISSVISDELQKYVNNGYLTTDKTWENEDLVVDGVTIIKKNTPLTLGYKVYIYPLSKSEINNNSAVPKIYVLIADAYSIRKIKVDGQVF